MKHSVIIIVFLFVFGGINNTIYAQKLSGYAKQKQQEKIEKQRMEQERYESACYQGSLEAFEEYLSLYPNGKYVRQVNERIVELRKAQEKAYYEEVCKKATLQSFKDYISRYPNGQYVTDINNRITDYDLWEKAKSQNTISAYRNYLNNSRFQTFSTQANEAITELESIEEWNRVKDSTTRYALDTFISKYPKSQYVEDARKKIHIIQGNEYYSTGNYQKALDEFKSAGGKYALDYNTRTKYDQCEENIAYNGLSFNSSENELSSFLTKYPNSIYKTYVMNMLAIAKAKQLNMYSTEYNFNNVLSYAQDDETRSKVKEYIDNCKKAMSKYKRQQRHERIMANGGYVGFGFDIWDFGLNVLTSKEDDRSFNLMYYNVALSFRIGNYKTPVYLELAVRPGGVLCKELHSYSYDPYYDYSYDNSDNKYFFHMPLSAKLKINLFRPWGDSKFYINGIGYYNAIRKKEYEAEFSVGGGIGVTNRHWDWQILYYRQDIDKDKIYNKNDIRYLGTSLGYFF